METSRRYSLSRYSLRTPREIEIRESFSEQLNTLCGPATLITVAMSCGEELSVDVLVSMEIPEALAGGGALCAAVTLLENAVAALQAGEALSALAAVGEDIPAAGGLLEALEASVGLSTDIPTGLTAAEELSAVLYMGQNIPDSLAGAAVLSAAAVVYKEILVREKWAACLRAATELHKDVHEIRSMAEALSAAVVVGQNIPVLPLPGSSGFQVRSYLSQNIPESAVLSAALMAVMDAALQTTETVVVELTIPPNGELRIDSEIFTVLLDGENVLYAQAGDWITVSRELLRVGVESASGGPLEGVLIYTERFL